MNAIVKVENVGMAFETKKGRFVALQDVNLQIRTGEVVSLIGHSGCGKSTLLNLIAGLTLPTSGVMLCNGREIAGPGPERAVVFQNHSLLPWLTCFENVYLAVERVFGAGSRTVGAPSENKAQLKARTDAALALVGLGHAASKRPGEIVVTTRDPSGHQTGPSPRGTSAETTSYCMRAAWQTPRARARRGRCRTRARAW